MSIYKKLIFESYFKDITISHKGLISLNDRIFSQTWIIDFDNPLGAGTFACIFPASCNERPGKFAAKYMKNPNFKIAQSEIEVVNILSRPDLQNDWLSKKSNLKKIPVVLPISYAQNDDELIILMEYMESDIIELLDKNDDSKICEILYYLLYGLEFLHQWFIHCDIKPTNILMNDGKPNLADFGIVHNTTLAFPTSSGYASYAYNSLWIEEGNTPTKRCDIENLVYLISHFKGSTEKSAENRKEEMKSAEHYISYFNITGVLKQFVKHALNIKQDEIPNYKFLRGVLKKGFD